MLHIGSIWRGLTRSTPNSQPPTLPGGLRWDNATAHLDAPPLDVRLGNFGYRLGGALAVELVLPDLCSGEDATVRVDSVGPDGAVFETRLLWHLTPGADGRCIVMLHYHARRRSEVAGWLVILNPARQQVHVCWLAAPSGAPMTAERYAADGAPTWTFADDAEPVRGSVDSRLFHRDRCGMGRWADRQLRFPSPTAALRDGFRPCRMCYA